MNPEAPYEKETGKGLDDFDFDGLGVEKALKEQLLKQQASTAPPKPTSGSRIIEESLQAAGRRERTGRSHAPGKQTASGTAAGGQGTKSDLLIDSKKLGHLSSEKTSATGSNGSQDSPQHTRMGKGKLFGGMGSARKLFTLQNAEATHGTSTTER